MAYLELKNLSIGYQDVPVVQNISMEIQKGEIVALIGPNGAGKFPAVSCLKGGQLQAIPTRRCPKKSPSFSPNAFGWS